MPNVDTALNIKVQALLEKQVAEGQQLGVQAAAYLNGHQIVSAWAGQHGAKDPSPVKGDSLFSSFSTTKGIAAVALHILADRGQIEYDVPVAKYWPEFAQNGKGKLTVAQAMSHQGGLHAAPPGEVMMDWERALKWTADAVPAYEPGTSTGYHAFTYAWVVGGIIQYATGRHIKEVIEKEIAEPLGIADELFCGIPDGVEHRLTTLRAAALPDPNAPGYVAPPPPDHDYWKAMPLNSGINFNSIEVRKACIPSANGHFTARALARVYAALANGGEIDGVRLVSKERIAKMSAIQTRWFDRVLQTEQPKSIGFMNGGDSGTGIVGVTGPRETAFGHSGAGGSTAFCDPEVGLSIAVTLNLMQNSLQGEGPTMEICHFIREELGLN